MVNMENLGRRDQSIQTKVPLDEDFEFRDLVTQTLEKNGALAKIKATLRASIFLAMDEDTKLNNLEPLKNTKLQSYIKTPEGRAMFSIVHEFLEYFNLNNTLMVYDSETCLETNYKYGGRKNVQNDLGLDNFEDLNIPILEQILQIAQSKTKVLDINLNVSNIHSAKESIVNGNSYNTTFCESIDSKLSSFNEDESKRVSNLNNMNATYDMNSPTVNIDPKNSTFVKNNRTSLDSVSEDSLNSPVISERNATFLKSRTSLESLQETLREEEVSTTEANLSIIEQNVSITNEDHSAISPLQLEETKLRFSESLSLKEELSNAASLKNKHSLNSLSDLPPLTINKTSANDRFPSVKNKEMKDSMSHLKELDKIFDMTNDYEEDFDLSIGKEYSGKHKDSVKK